MRLSHGEKLVPLSGLLLIGLFMLPNVAHAAAATQQGGTTGILTPLYSYPGSSWDNLIWAKQTNPSVPMIAVINPNDGPGSWIDPNFVSGIDRLQSAGVVVIGYIWTDYGARSISSIEADISNYKNWYGVNGIYLDQMSNVPGHEAYYSTLTQYAESLGMTITVGNPGASVPPSYIGTVTTIVIYENSGEPSINALAGLASYAKSNFAVVAYNVPSLSTSYLSGAENYLGYIYLTNGIMPNPYSLDSSYLDNLATALQTYDSQVAGGQGTITVNTDTTNGQVLNGMYTLLLQNGVVQQTCFSPCTFTVNGGQSYSVLVSNYAQYSFADWGNGLQSPYFSVVEPGQATHLSLWAFYNT